MDVFVISDICQVEEAWRINLKRFNDLIYVANLCVGIALSLSLSLSLSLFFTHLILWVQSLISFSLTLLYEICKCPNKHLLPT